MCLWSLTYSWPAGNFFLFLHRAKKITTVYLQKKNHLLNTTQHQLLQKKIMSGCSAYGMPESYANYPTFNSNFYSAPSNDSYNNMTNSNVQQQLQLNLNSLMPANWQNSAVRSMSSDPKDDWSSYTVNPDAVQRYISASGASRFRQIDRSSAGRRFGQPNLLRSKPRTALSMEPTVGPWFNTSSDYQALVTPSMRPFIGCGQ
jgi:hypothetical protein